MPAAAAATATGIFNPNCWSGSSSGSRRRRKTRGDSCKIFPQSFVCSHFFVVEQKVHSLGPTETNVLALARHVQRGSIKRLKISAPKIKNKERISIFCSLRLIALFHCLKFNQMQNEGMQIDSRIWNLAEKIFQCRRHRQPGKGSFKHRHVQQK